ncbi:AmmeMemoRadiSam system radical SAM enzyme, partial [Planctomycetota bacterium]
MRCNLCEHRCEIPEGRVGICWVRGNQNGKLLTFVKDLAIASHIDPIEKKPLFHAAPGTNILSIATAGCNFRCSFCQNWQISQQPKGKTSGRIEGRSLKPEDLVNMALARNCSSIAYTYSEPTIFFEYAYETARLATEAGLFNVFVTNGYMTEEALAKIRPYLQCANVDLKGFNEKLYHKITGGKLQHVKNFISKAWNIGVFLEVTTLIIPGFNDSEDELKQITDFLASVSPDIPYHLSRFHPDYKMLDRPPTSFETLEQAYNIAKQSGLKFVYVGNIHGNAYETTYCPDCGKSLIERAGYAIKANHLKLGCC